MSDNTVRQHADEMSEDVELKSAVEFENIATELLEKTRSFCC